MDKIIQIIAICFLKSTTKGDSLNSYDEFSQNNSIKIRLIHDNPESVINNIYEHWLRRAEGSWALYGLSC